MLEDRGKFPNPAGQNFSECIWRILGDVKKFKHAPVLLDSPCHSRFRCRRQTQNRQK
jgi:hypothetical protein